MVRRVELHAVILGCVQKWVFHQRLLPKAGRQRSVIKTPSLAASGTPKVSMSLLSTTLRSLLCRQLANSSVAPDHGVTPSHLPSRPHQTRIAAQVRSDRGLDPLAGTTQDRWVYCVHKTFHLLPGIWEPQLSCKHCTPRNHRSQEIFLLPEEIVTNKRSSQTYHLLISNSFLRLLPAKMFKIWEQSFETSFPSWHHKKKN